MCVQWADVEKTMVNVSDTKPEWNYVFLNEYEREENSGPNTSWYLHSCASFWQTQQHLCASSRRTGFTLTVKKTVTSVAGWSKNIFQASLETAKAITWHKCDKSRQSSSKTGIFQIWSQTRFVSITDGNIKFALISNSQAQINVWILYVQVLLFKVFQLGSHNPKTSLRPAGVIKTDDHTFGVEYCEISRHHFCLLNNSQAYFISAPRTLQTPLKIPLLTVRRAKCNNAVLCMTSIKRFHSPEAQNNPARKKKNCSAAENHFSLIL